MNKERQEQARERLINHGVQLGEDFHTLSWDQVARIITAADEHRYRKPKNANGSRARMFYEYANRGR